MLIFTLAAAMTLAMLIATALSLHQETQRVRLEHHLNESRRLHRWKK